MTATKITSPYHLFYPRLLLLAAAMLLTQFPGTEGRTLPQLSSDWHLWKSTHGKDYSSFREELYRHVIWQSNKRFIEAHNTFNYTFGYTLAMNQMGDLVSTHVYIYLWSKRMTMHARIYLF